MRERELEVEVARLNAELAVLKGGAEPAEVAARFLTMAASTVDQAMADARREADEIVQGVAAEAEARRDEATRAAAEAEAKTEALRVEAHNQQAAVEAARHEAQRVTDAATEHINNERARVADEVERLAEVRSALETERSSLETYHEELKRRVQELAESMVSFMTTEPPLAAVTAIDELAKPAIAPAAFAVEAAFAPATPAEADPVETDAFDEPAFDEVPGLAAVDAPSSLEANPFGEPEPEPEIEVEVEVDQQAAADSEPTSLAEPIIEPDPVAHDAVPVAEPEPVFVSEPIADVPSLQDDLPVVDAAPVIEPDPTVTSTPDFPPFGDDSDDLTAVAPIADAPSFTAPAGESSGLADALAAAAGPDEVVEDAGALTDSTDPAPTEENESLFGRPIPPASAGRGLFDAPTQPPTPSFADMMSGRVEAPVAEFGGVPVADPVEEVPARRKMGGLFSRTRNNDDADVEPILPEAPKVEGGLFGSQASRLIEQTSPEHLASALSDDSEEDERFRSFLDGDGENDPSRDWLLRPDQED